MRKEEWALGRHGQGTGKGKTGPTGRVPQTLEQASLRRYLGRGLKEEESKVPDRGIGCARILRYERVW